MNKKESDKKTKLIQDKCNTVCKISSNPTHKASGNELEREKVDFFIKSEILITSHLKAELLLFWFVALWLHCNLCSLETETNSFWFPWIQQMINFTYVLTSVK